MDYRELFAHLIEHMVRKVPENCEFDCKVSHPEDGGIETSKFVGQSSKRTDKLLDAMCAVGLAARVETYEPSQGYFPTAKGIEYLEQYRRPIQYWLARNWFPSLVAALAVLVPIFLKVMDIAFLSSSP